tara:strand:+ start:470 stop:1102 length:633 start_codon:yes stop_codon:yes gene_type:complete
MNKCSEIVFDSMTHRDRKCKKKFNFVIENCKYCHLHANLYYKQYICKIQATFRGYKQRRMLKYFKAMPCDIQSKIIGYIKDEHSIIKYNQRLSNFLLKKMVVEITQITNNFYNTMRYTLRRSIITNGTFVRCFKLILVYKKYKTIIHLNPEFKKIIYTNSYYKDNYNISYFINLLIVCIIDIINTEDEYFKQSFMDKGFDYFVLINSINS